jgi:glycogen operon protein
VRGSLADFGSRFTGSPDLYADDGRRPFASVNLISAHDGFTLADLVSFDHKHNEANGEDGRDGEDHNRSWNSGAEGPTDDAAVLALRARRQRSLLATLLLSQGMPMLLGGDEIGRSQGGNNNAYAQDGPISWYDWAAADESLLSFTERLVRLRLDHPVFRRGAWLRGAPEDPTGMPDIGWFRPDGREMEEGDWIGSANRLGILLSPAGLRDGADRPVTDDTFFVALNASGRGTRFRLPALDPGRRWRTVFDTGSDPTFPVRPPMHHGGMRVRVAPFAVALLRRDGR